MDVGFTGTSVGLTARQYGELERLLLVLRVWGFDRFHHGDCIGADAAAHEMARSFGMRVIKHPPEDPKAQAHCQGAQEVRRARPYLDRNIDIVSESQLLVACPREREEIRRSGTWSTVRRAREQGKPIILVLPNGAIKMKLHHVRVG